MTCIVRSPLLDPKQKVLGYKLAWQPARAGSGGRQAPADLASLASWVARKPLKAQPGWLVGDSLLFLEAAPEPLLPDTFAALVPANTVLSLTQAQLADPATVAAAAALREQGFGLSLRQPDSFALPQELLDLLTHIELTLDQAGQADRFNLPVAQGKPRVRVVVSGLASWDDYTASTALGVDAFVGNVYATSAAADAVGRLSPESLLILQLMQMVQANVDARHLETALKRDAALSYQLLRYLNSASFGLPVEVQSMRHAIAIIGYRPLYRWLAVLLASANARTSSPVLMQAAVIRGRFAELLGQGLLPQQEAESLFVAGMFSLLDRLLGVPISEVLDKIQLPDAVVQALLTRDGIYGPFLRLAEACESTDGGAAELAESAFLTTEQTNRAHISALAWALDLGV